MDGLFNARPEVLIDLPSAIPKVKREVPHELDMTMLDINGGTQASDILGHVVAEDN